MKFVCKSCGFSASIPEKKEVCPFCKSSNVENKNEVSSENLFVNQTDSKKEESKEERKNKLTLTDNFFEENPGKEEREVYEVIKELHIQEKSKQKEKISGKKIVYIAAVILIFLTSAYFSFYFLTLDKSSSELSDNKLAEEKEISVENKAADFVEKGIREFNSGNYSGAIHFFKNAVSEDGKLSKAYKGLADAYAQNGEKLNACENYRKYLELAPDAPEKNKVEEFLKSCE